jgi:hypothetical protein
MDTQPTSIITIGGFTTAQSKELNGTNYGPNLITKLSVNTLGHDLATGVQLMHLTEIRHLQKFKQSLQRLILEHGTSCGQDVKKSIKLNLFFSSA